MCAKSWTPCAPQVHSVAPMGNLAHPPDPPNASFAFSTVMVSLGLPLALHLELGHGFKV